MWQGFQNYQSGLRERMSGQSSPMSGFAGTDGYLGKIRPKMGMEESNPQPMSIADSFRRIKGGFSGAPPVNYAGMPSMVDSFQKMKSMFVSPMSQKTLRSFTPAHGANSPIPRGDQQSAMANPYTQGGVYA